MATKTNTKETNLEMTHKYYSEAGVVIGKLTQGGIGYATARNFEADTYKELEEKVLKAFNLGSLDGEFSFQSLVAAGVVLVDEASVEIDGRVFTSIQKINCVMGDEDLFNDKVNQGYIFDENAVRE